MAVYPASVEILIEKLTKFPGVGRRSAERIVNYILHAPKEDIKALSGAIDAVKENVRLCSVCNNLSEGDVCAICANERRRKDLVCVVEKPADVTAMEKAGRYEGVYHVLMGSISPLEGRGPADLKLEGLYNRIKQGNISEVIIATDADTEGETTAMYLTGVLKSLSVRVSRIGLGLPVGSNLEFADSETLFKAMESRRDLHLP
ncbi:MAG: recombination mediator RecR [Candidatus Omnitrophota bacterium]|jgi:recombination protein RecR|nr:recombination mediator RecR [Candidatus Omnitrophota bacterium]MDD3983924.1 recombination mediator RecR [Candidatus Omnitrophota bacterium]